MLTVEASASRSAFVGVLSRGPNYVIQPGGSVEISGIVERYFKIYPDPSIVFLKVIFYPCDKVVYDNTGYSEDTVQGQAKFDLVSVPQ
jgi:hypothetical protein